MRKKRPAKRELLLLVLIIGMLSLIVLPSPPLDDQKTHSVRRAACVGNLYRLGPALDVYALEDAGEYPLIDNTKNNFIFEGNVYPKRLTDAGIAACPLTLPAAKSQYLEGAGVALLAAMGILAATGLDRLRGKYWILGYLLSLLIIAVVAVARRQPPLGFVPPISWMMAGRTEFAALGFACTTLLTTVLVRLPRKGEKVLIGILMTVAASYLSVLPFVLPPLLRGYQIGLDANFDSDGVCLQSNYFNCGPAAAVTALRSLGISAREGEIAVLAQTNPASGTQPDILQAALQDAYGEAGLCCEYRTFTSIAELNGAVPAVALVKWNLATDHCVAVLEVTDDEVVLGDPAEGKKSLSYAEFEKIWRFSAIVLSRKAP